MQFTAFNWRSRCVALLCCCSPLLLIAQRYYVDALANGSPDGQTWATAFHDLHAALALALPGDEVWVAQGVYHPSETGDRQARYQLPSGVKLYGGFAGTEMLLTERQPGQYPSVLSGDLGVVGDSLDNSYTLLYLPYPDTATLVDGFTLRDALADDPAVESGEPGQSGAALYVQGSNGTAYPTIRHCTFEDNTARGSGGAVYINGSGSGSVAPLFEGCQFLHNRSAQNGGGLCRAGGSWWDRPVDFLRCTFEANRARWGACLYVADAERSDTLDLRQCNFYRNAASFNADVLGLANLRQLSWSVVQFSRCDMVENKSGGLLMANSFFEAGNVDLRLDSMLLYDNQVNNPTSAIASAIYLSLFGKAKCTIANSTLSGQPQPDSSILYPSNYHINVEGYENDGKENHLNVVNSNLHQCNVTLDCFNLDIQRMQTANTSLILASRPGRTNISNSSFYKTSLAMERTLQKTIQNCVFVNNYTYNENMDDSLVEISNTIISKLRRGINTQAFLFNASHFNIRNSIFSDTFYCCTSYSLIPFPGLPIGLDPMLVDTSQGDFHPLPCSPTWNAGDNASVLNLGLLTDLAGAPRIIDGQVDIGAYESPALALAAPPATTGACFSEPTGTLQWVLEHGCPPYNYTWANGSQTGTSLTGLAAGTYQYTITDLLGRTLVSSAQVPASAPQLMLTGDTLICPAASTGKLTAAVGGAVVPPINYHWSNGATTDGLSDLSLGHYILTITDAAGCSDVASANIGLSGPVLSLSAQITPASAVGASNGSIQITVQNGHGPYAARWIPRGDTTLSINGLLPGLYTLEVTDGGSCIYTYTYEVDVINATDAPDVPPLGSVLPNPARDQVTLYFGNSAVWQLYSPAGQEVMRVEGQGIGGTLDVYLSNLSPGIYFYAFQTKNGQPLSWHRLAIVR